MPMPSVEKLLDIGIALSSEKNGEKILEMILTAAMEITDCDGGTLYVLEDGALRYRIMITKSLGIRKGMDGDAVDMPPVAMSPENVSAYAALDKTPVNIPDIYEDGIFNFSGPRAFDAKMDYRTLSLLTVPMEDEHGDVVGVLQLINAMNESAKPIPFDHVYERVIYSLASQAATCLVRMQRAAEVSELLDSFVGVMSAAIDARSPYTANHSRNMVKYAEKYLAWLDDFGPAPLDELWKKQFLMSIRLHDIGKLVVPLEIMDKESRLGSKIEGIMHRFQTIGLQNELDFAKGLISEVERGRRADELDAAKELVRSADRADYLPDEKLEAIRALGETKARTPEGEAPYLSEDELTCLLVRKGTLTDNERKTIENHVSMTRRMLDEVSFPKRYRPVSEWASSHHEFLNGSGYPDKLADGEIPAEVRTLTILDVYDALTARDRPYKQAAPAEKAFAILDEMALRGQIDADILELFKRSEAWKD